MKRLVILVTLFSFLFLNLPGQSDFRLSDSLKQVIPLQNGSFKLMEFTQDSLLAYMGTLSSSQPPIRDGSFYFYHSNGKVAAAGSYSQDVPIGTWIYLYPDGDTLEVIDYNPVWDILDKEARGVKLDLSTIDSLPRKWRREMNADGTFFSPEVRPRFNGDAPEKSFEKYVKDHLIFPAFAEANQLVGSVQTTFIIDTEGKIINLGISYSMLSDFAIEALRILIESPDWQPGTINGYPVNVPMEWNFYFSDRKVIPPSPGIDSAPDNTQSEDVFYIVEEMPKFNGGDPAIEFRKFIAQNLRYPEEAAEKGIHGRVIVQFAVNADGEVVDPLIVRGIHPLLDTEAIRVVMASPRWTPGRQRGENVKVLFTFPINFVLGII